MDDLTPIEWLDATRIAASIQGLNPTAFANLCNDLLIETAILIGASPGCIRTTLEVFESDEGLDAGCLQAGTVVPPWIPHEATVGYQYRAGRSKKAARKVIEEDIQNKAGVMSLLVDGGTFVFISAWDRGRNFEEDIRRAAAEAGLELRDDQLYYIGGDFLARQLLRLPGLLCRLVDIGGLMNFSEWRRLPALTNPFEMDEAVQARIEGLRARVSEARARLRIVGRPGDGKTRTVREALEGTRLERSTLYARHGEVIPRRLLTYLRRAERVRCTLVVDEADPATMKDLEEDLSVARSPEVRLIVIGHAHLGRQPQEGADLLEVAPLDEELLREIVSADAPGIPDEIARDIARVCSGSPKLALLLSNRVQTQPELASRQRLLADRKVQDALDAALSIDLTEEVWRAAAAVALLDHVGWEADLSDESEQLFAAMGLDSVAARHAVEELDKRLGIVPLAGRLRYVSPLILGDHLAVKQIRAWTRTQLQTFLANLTPRMAHGFATRVRQIGSALEANRRVVEELILGHEGPFRSMDDLERGRTSQVIRQLAGPFRHGTLGLLQRLIEPATKHELKAATTSRRDLVHALEELLWFEETFETAALLLLRLAAAENEHWGNNATGIWQETFQTVLGRTAAGPERRLRVLEKAAKSPDADERRLAADAIQAGLRFGRAHRMGVPPRDVEGAPDEAWQPQTWGEWVELLREYLDLLEPLLADENNEVRRSAVEAVAEGTRAAWVLPGLADRWDELVQVVTEAAFELRSSLRRRIRTEVRRGRRELDASRDELSEASAADRQQRLEDLENLARELEGQDFESRFRHGLTLQHHEAAGSFEVGDQRIKQGLEELAAEVLDHPELLDGQWSWLVADRPVHVGEWLYEVGKRDCERRMAHKIAEVALARRDTWNWLSIYDLGFMHDCADDSYVGRRLAELRKQGTPPEQQLDFVVRTGYSKEKFQQVYGLFDSGELPPSAVARLKYSRWTDELDVEDAERLVEQLIDEPECVQHLITFLYGFLRVRPEAREQFRKVALKLLGEPVKSETRATFDYEWTELAEFYLEKSAVEVSQSALYRIAQRKVAYDDRLTELVRSAWQSGPAQKIFELVIAPWITADSVGAWWVQKALTPFPLWELEPGALCEWIEEDPARRAVAVAELVGAPSGKVPTQLHASLLDRPGHYNIGDIFFTDLITGTWTGSAAERTRGLIAQARRWLKDERGAIQAWAQQTVERLEAILKQEEQREAEENLRW